MRIGKEVIRGPNDKIISNSLWLNHNNLEMITGIVSFCNKIFEAPSKIKWIDLSYNSIEDISEVIFMRITDVYHLVLGRKKITIKLKYQNFRSKSKFSAKVVRADYKIIHPQLRLILRMVTSQQLQSCMSQI